MEETIKVNINGKDYNLTGDDKEAILFAANVINNEINKLNKKNITDNPETLAILAALNIAELYYKEKKQKATEENYLVTELDKMANYVSNMQSSLISK